MEAPEKTTGITPRERALMAAAMKSAEFYSDVDEWLGEIISDGGHTVEQHLLHDIELTHGCQPSVEQLQKENAELKETIKDLLNDCINFDNGNLTDAIMSRASDVLHSKELKPKLQQRVPDKPIGYVDCSKDKLSEAGYFTTGPVTNHKGWVAVYAAPQPPETVQQKFPGFLLEMSKQMREQPTRMTAHPIWQVRCNRYLPTQEGCNESHRVVVGEDGVIWRSIDPVDELVSYLLDYHEEWCATWASENEHMEDYDSVAEAMDACFDPSDGEFPDGLSMIPVQEVEDIVSTHLTQSDAEWFIRRKQHDYPPLYTYVESAYWSPQVKQLQDWIIRLTDAPAPQGQREGE